MIDSRTNWDRLNAYVDGELPPDDAAAVAEAVARDPALARQVAALTSLKAAVVDAAPAHPGRLAGLPRCARAPWRVAALAATLLLGVLLTAGWIAELHRAPPGIALAQQLHQEWAATRAHAATDAATRPVNVGLASLKLAYVPDLTQVELAFDGVRQVSARGGHGLHVGYLGPRGCAVSLVVFERPGRREEPLAALGDDGRPAWRWSTGGASFYLLAPAMDPQRLAGIARVVQRLTRARLPLDTEGVLALDRARSGAEPCLA